MNIDTSLLKASLPPLASLFFLLLLFLQWGKTSLPIPKIQLLPPARTIPLILQYAYSTRAPPQTSASHAPHSLLWPFARLFFSLTCCHHSLFTMARWWRFCRVAIGILEIRHWVASTFLFLVLFPPFLSVGAGGFARTELASALLRVPDVESLLLSSSSSSSPVAGRRDMIAVGTGWKIFPAGPHDSVLRD